MTFRTAGLCQNLTVNTVPLPTFGLNQQPGAMAGEDMLDDGKPKAGAFFRPAGLHVNPVESFGNARNMLGRDYPARDRERILLRAYRRRLTA